MRLLHPAAIDPRHRNQKRSCRILFSLPAKEAQAIVVRRECDLRTLREVEDVPRYGVDLVARLVADVEAALHDDLHLVVCILIDERRALLETVEAGANRLLGVVLLPAMPLVSCRVCDKQVGSSGLRGRDITKKCVLVRNQRRLDFLRLRIEGERHRA